MDTATPEYLEPAETAVLVRTALKNAFPGQTFRVRSSTSIYVSWTDGPSVPEVEMLVAPFAGEVFDGSIDLGVPVHHWLLPDGSVQVRWTPGTVDQHGHLTPEQSLEPLVEGARPVVFGSRFVFADRDISIDFEDRMHALYEALYEEEEVDHGVWECEERYQDLITRTAATRELMTAETSAELLAAYEAQNADPAVEVTL